MEKMGKNTVVDYFKVPSQRLPERNREIRMKVAVF
jgi:hypothetical protein